MLRKLWLLALLGQPVMAETPVAPPEVARPVISQIVSQGEVQSRSFTGTVEAEVTTPLAFLTLGRVATLSVATGDEVHKGDVLATLDQVTLNEDLTAAQAALQGAKGRADFAQQSYDRTQVLVQRGGASAAQQESVTAARDTALAALNAAEADLARATDAASYSALKAPIDGVITATLVEPGTVVSVGTPIVTLAGLTGREAVLDVPAEVLAILKLGDTFEVAGRGAAPVTGTLKVIEPSAGAGTRSRRLRLTLTDAPASYRIGSLISAHLSARAVVVMTLPKVALTGTPDAPKVWRVGQGRKVALVPVTLGQDLGEDIIITGGLVAGDEIVVRGVHSLTEGQIVGERIE